jgi:hypothetical protein
MLQLQAECEMGAFLEAAAEVLGLDDRWLAADAWLDAMESLRWSADDHQKFFRSVSVRAISQIAALSSPATASATRSSNRK